MTFNFKKGIKNSFQLFCQTTSLTGYKYLQECRSHNKLLWIFVHIVLTIFTIFLVITLWLDFMKNPTFITLEISDHPVRKVPFPGISVWSVNKISKKKAEHFSQVISNLTKMNYDIIFNYMKLLGSFYDFNIVEFNRFIEFQYILDSLHHEEFKVPNLLKSISLSCNDLLKECYWKGESVNCSKIFSFDSTFEGYCCNFNYVPYIKLKMGKVVKFGIPGEANGLHIVLRNEPDDYFYSTISTLGTKINFFNPFNYPDRTSGGLNENLIQIASENIFEISPTTFFSVKEVMKYPLKKRKCLFPSERKTYFGEYSQSDCLVDCKIKSMLALCGCIPFMMPYKNKDLVCSLIDIPCMNKFESKWNSLYPYNEVDDPTNLEVELQNGLQCEPKCYPVCSQTMYTITTNAMTFPNKSFGNDSVVHIFYTKRHSSLYKHDVVYYWFEILSNFGGAFGLIIGFSIITLVEILIYCTYKFLQFSFQKD